VQTQRLITLDEVRNSEYLPSKDSESGKERLVMITEDDYLMGVFDLSGEIMRIAVTTLSNAPTTFGGENPVGGVVDAETPALKNKGRALQPQQAAIVKDLRDLRARCEALNVPRRHAAQMMRDLMKKLEVMQTSVEKVERAAYGILVRGSERPSGWMPELGGSTVQSTRNGNEVESF
jgi:hypothetical protein